MRFGCCFLMALVAQVGLAVPTYLCQKAGMPIVIDGQLEEAAWQAAKPLSPLRDLSGKASAFAADIRMMYDETYLYVGARLPEQSLQATLTERDSIIYHDDDFEIFIDPSGRGKHYLELEVNQLNTVWDLFITAPYREGDNCIALHDWDIKGLKTAVSLQGTLNQGEGDDQSWTVEVAWPWASITGHSHLPRRGEPPQPGTEMRFNFSRVDHDGGVEWNTVWAPTRQVTIHAPEHWGRVRFSDKVVGTQESFPPQVGLWVHGNDAALTAEQVQAWAEAGVTTLVIDGSPEAIARISAWGKAAGLQTVAWFWSLNRPDDAEALKHPSWYAVSAEGKGCHKESERPFVPYYQFLCPSNDAARAYLCQQIQTIAQIPTVDAVQLDYIRMPDVVLPKALWPTYGLDMSTTLPAYDFCYCATCQAAFGQTPQADDAAWREFRLNRVAAVANALADTVRASGKPCGAAVFPTPAMAATMVYQDWSRFNLDFAFPMVYASFYGEPSDWIVARTVEARQQLQGRYPIYPGLHLPDLPPEALKAIISDLLEVNPEGVCLFSHETFTPERQATLKALLQR
ncbi:MAG: hypothetical protein IKW23_05155 [Kiritimatiellae bacterium]|nr:hypothetical protein [Kiritimatiellia bacterium]